jgi:hypothetical protein
MTNNTFQQRIQAWKQVIIDGMVKQIKDDSNKEAVQKRRDIELIRGKLGDRIVVNRICLALGISERQLIRRLVMVHTPKPRKPAVVR